MFRISLFCLLCLVCMPVVAPAALTKAAADSNRAALLINASNGHILYQHNAHVPRYPASLTKLMTAYLAFESLQQGNLRMDQKVVVSKHASMQPPRKIYFRPGEFVRVKDLLRAVIISSANDAAVAVAETIGGTEDDFAKLMNKKAKEIGLKHTTFQNASGLHHPQHITTAYDMAKLAMEIYRRFPQYCHFFAETQYVLKNVRYRGGNTVTELYSHMVDGMKTGFTDAAGYNLISSALKDNVRIVGIVMGRTSVVERDLDMVMLLKKGFGQNAAAGPLIPSPVLKAQRTKKL